MKDTIEGNKIIAEFMGAKVLDNNACKPYPNELPHWAKRLYDLDTLRIGGYEYHTSFDWLMPVVEKIEDIDEGRYQVTIQYRQCTIDDVEVFWSDSMIQYEAEEKESQISVVWKAVAQFIEWYNKENHKA